MTASCDPWNLDGHTPSKEPTYVANGYLGTAIAPDGGALFDSVPNPCFVRGLYSPSGTDGIDRYAPLPSWNTLRYGAPARLLQYARRLDLRRGELFTRFTLEEDRGVVHLEQRIFVSRADRHRAAVHLRIVPMFDGEVTVISTMDFQDDSGLTIVGSGMDAGSLWTQGVVAAYAIDVSERLVIQADAWSTVDESAMPGSWLGLCAPRSVRDKR